MPKKSENGSVEKVQNGIAGLGASLGSLAVAGSTLKPFDDAERLRRESFSTFEKDMIKVIDTLNWYRRTSFDARNSPDQTKTIANELKMYLDSFVSRMMK